MPGSLPAILAVIILVSQPGLSGPRKNSTALYNDAAKLALSGNLDGAFTAFKEVIDISPSYALGYYGMGKACLYREGKIDDAVIYLRMSVKLDSGLAKGYFYLGMALMLKKRYGDSLNAFFSAYKLDNTIIEALYNIGVVYEILGKKNMAAKYFEDYELRKQKRDENIIF